MIEHTRARVPRTDRLPFVKIGKVRAVSIQSGPGLPGQAVENRVNLPRRRYNGQRATARRAPLERKGQFSHGLNETSVPEVDVC